MTSEENTSYVVLRTSMTTAHKEENKVSFMENTTRQYNTTHTSNCKNFYTTFLKSKSM